ncbi:MAG: polysaccharide pyruvyl transferase family protein [Acetobacteraceae bacterium]
MILYQWRGAVRNFGDELNSLVWPQLLPGFFDSDPAALFLGIGSILDGRHRAEATKLVAGSGYGGYEARPTLDHRWIIHWVRGPHTARHLGLPPSLALGDPASLLPLIGHGRAVSDGAIGFMPHFESMERGAWDVAARQAGVTLIDSRQDPLAVLSAIGRCRVLISEALHGVIVADALRVPWIAIRPLARVHRAKWNDWAAVLGIRIASRRLPPSSMLEWAGVSCLGTWHRGRDLLHHHRTRIRAACAEGFSDRAAAALTRIASHEPQLSGDSALHRSQLRMLDRVEALRRQPFRAVIEETVPPRNRSVLHAHEGFAYHHSSIG